MEYRRMTATPLNSNEARQVLSCPVWLVPAVLGHANTAHIQHSQSYTAALTWSTYVCTGEVLSAQDSEVADSWKIGRMLTKNTQIKRQEKERCNSKEKACSALQTGGY